MALNMKNYCISLFTLALLSLLSTLNVQAELIWEEDTGWQVKGGVLDPMIGEELSARNALELMNVARKRQEDKSYFRALSAYSTVYEDYSASIYAPEALFQSARIHIARNQFDDAYDELNIIVERYPEYPNFNSVIGQQFEIASQLMEGKRPYYWGFLPGLRDEVAAMDYFEGIVEKAPYSRYAPVALMNIALVAKSKGKTDEAIDALDRLITNYPKSILASDAYLNLAKTFASLVDGAYYDQNATHEAISYYRDFLVIFPKDPNLAEAESGLNNMLDTLSRSKLLIGDFYWRYRNNTTAAKIFLNDAITIAPESPSAQEARALLERIQGGEQPPRTPVDWLFGEYDNAPEPQEETPAIEAKPVTPAPAPKSQAPAPKSQDTINPTWN